MAKKRENWKEIPGYEGKYEIEKDSKRIRNKRTNYILHPGSHSRELLFSLYDILGVKKTYNLNSVWRMTFGGDEDA